MKRSAFWLGTMVMVALLVGCGGQQASTPASSGTEASGTAGGTADAGGGAADGVIAIAVTEEGFEPATVTVAVGQPVRLVVTRKTTKTCATELVMKEHNINQPLPLDTPVEITFTPTQTGELNYACAMDMYKGKVIVK